MIKESYALTIDFGTQSVRAIIFNKKGDVLAMEKHVYNPAYFSTKPGYCEQHADYYYEKMCLVTNALVDKNPELIKNITTSAITCFRDTAVCLDENKRPIRPCILWCDQRMAKCEKPMPFFRNLLFKVVGMSYTAEMNRQRTMYNWLLETEPETISKTKHYVSLSTYLIYKLTGELKDAVGNYTGHYPFNM